MTICVPTENDGGMGAPVSPHFGMAPYFAFIDSETKKIEFVANASRGHSHGRCKAVDVVAERHPDTILTSEIGPGAFDALHADGKAIYRTNDTRLDDALAGLEAGRATEITRDQAVGHHHHERLHADEGVHLHARHDRASGGHGEGADRGEHR